MANTTAQAISGRAHATVCEATDYQRHYGYRLYLNRVLDELPGAVFAAMTLMWIITSFGGLVW